MVNDSARKIISIIAAALDDADDDVSDIVSVWDVHPNLISQKKKMENASQMDLSGVCDPFQSMAM